MLAAMPKASLDWTCFLSWSAIHATWYSGHLCCWRQADKACASLRHAARQFFVFNNPKAKGRSQGEFELQTFLNAFGDMQLPEIPAFSWRVRTAVQRGWSSC